MGGVSRRLLGHDAGHLPLGPWAAASLVTRATRVPRAASRLDVVVAPVASRCFVIIALLLLLLRRGRLVLTLARLIPVRLNLYGHHDERLDPVAPRRVRDRFAHLALVKHEILLQLLLHLTREPPHGPLHILVDRHRVQLRVPPLRQLRRHPLVTPLLPRGVRLGDAAIRRPQPPRRPVHRREREADELRDEKHRDAERRLEYLVLERAGDPPVRVPREQGVQEQERSHERERDPRPDQRDEDPERARPWGPRHDHEHVVVGEDDLLSNARVDQLRADPRLERARDVRVLQLERREPSSFAVRLVLHLEDLLVVLRERGGVALAVPVEVLLGLQQLNVGRAAEAGIAIVLLAIVLDRITQSYGETLQERNAPSKKAKK